MLTHSEKVIALRMIVEGARNKAIMDFLKSQTATNGDLAQLRLQLRNKQRTQYRMEKAKEMIAGMLDHEISEIKVFLRGFA